MTAPSKFFSLPWPAGGISEHQSFTNQERASSRTGTPPTCVDARNVRNYDPTTGRLRGSQRCGISKFFAEQCGPCPVVHINHLVASSIAVSAGGSGTRSMKGVAVGCGNIRGFDSSGFTATTGGTGVLDATFKSVNSAELFGRLYFCDGTHYKVWDANTDAVDDWIADVASVPLPYNGAHAARLICCWRGRIVLSGVIGDGQNWFMSRLGDALDWDTGATPVDETMAISGNEAETGKCADVINCLIPYSDDFLIFGGDHSIWQMTNDPMAGGRLDLVSGTIGMAFGTAWCMDPAGLVYFVGSRGGLFVMAPGSLPKRLSSERLEERLAEIDLSTHVVRLAWNDRDQSVMIAITETAGAATVHYVYDTRNAAFWPDSYTNPDHNPMCLHAMDGDDPGDRVLLLGCYDGYIRFLDLEAKQDDGSAISSFVWLGPLQARGGLKVRLHEMQATLGADSDPVTFGVYDGPNAEDAFNRAMPRFSGTWSLPANRAEQRQAINGAIYVRLSSNTLDKAWQLEDIVAAVQTTGRASGRVFDVA